MRVIGLTAENYKRLKAVEIRPDPEAGIVVISGRNAAGKTSCLDAIWETLAGGKAQRAERPIRDGEDEARVEVDLGDFIVARQWTRTADGTKGTITVTSKDGARYPSPQRFLDEKLGALSFDPLAFAGMDDKKQVETLLSVVDLGKFDPADHEAKRRAVYDQRSDVNRAAKILEGKLSGAKRPTEVRELVDVGDLIEDRRAKELGNRRSDEVRQDLVAAMGRVERARAALDAELTNLEEIQAAFEKLPEDHDLAAIEEAIRLAGETNQAIQIERTAAEAFAELDKLHEQSQALTGKLELGDEYKKRKLAEARMPVDGLGFSEDGVTFNDVPLSQCSAAERLRVSTAVAMALNPEVRVILIRDGSLLDEQSLALLEDMAADKDYQVFLEMVARGEPVGFVIEDGQVTDGK